MDDKYVVIKKADWENYLSEDRDLWYDDAVQLPITGGHFVVREQDIFAPAGLYAYSANIRTSLEFMEYAAPLGFLTDDERERLYALADDLATTAMKWQSGETMRKVPD